MTRTERFSCVWGAAVLLGGLATACSTGSPVSPSSGSGATLVSSADRRVGGVGGGVGDCEDEVRCADPGMLQLSTASGATLDGALYRGGWYISGGSGHFEGSQGEAAFTAHGDQLDAWINFEVTGLPNQRPILSTGRLLRVNSSTGSAAACSSGTQMTQVYRGTMESLGLVTLTLQTCAYPG